MAEPRFPPQPVPTLGQPARGTLAAGPTALLELDAVTKTYRTDAGEVQALRSVDLRIDTGDYVAIMGPSGSGKSTLMHILGCLDIPTSGRYRLAGQDVSNLSDTELAEVRNTRIGFVFQQFHLLPTMTALRNVELPLVYAGVPAGQRRDRAAAALTRVGLADRLTHRPNQLSGGQQQRVAVARALVTEPALILADEPTGNLDSAATAEALGLFADLHASGRTVVLITHEAEVAAATRRTVRFRDGRIVADSDQTNAEQPGSPPTGAALTDATQTGTP